MDNHAGRESARQALNSAIVGSCHRNRNGNSKFLRGSPAKNFFSLATLAPILFLALAFVSPLAAQQNVLTWHDNNSRTGEDLHETILKPSNVKPSTFGKLFVIHADGKVDAQPLYLANVSIPGMGRHNVLYVATEHDSVYAFDAGDGHELWHVSMLNPGETTSDARHCGQVNPEIGVTATPVIDPSVGPHGTIYVVAMSKNSAGQYFQRLHALDLTTGKEEFGGPIDIHAQYPGTGDNSKDGMVIFDPKQYKERPGLLLVGHTVVTSWSSHCDIRPYTGWVMNYNALTLKQTSVLDLAPSGNEAAVWQSGAGPAADSSGNIYLLAGNGTFDTTLTRAGFPDHSDYGNAFLKLAIQDGKLKVADYFDMDNTIAESDRDEDLGSGGAMVLPPMKNAKGQVMHLAVGAGKDQNIYLINRDHMGKFNPLRNDIDQELVHALKGREFGAPAYFDGVLYYGAVNDSIRAFQFSNARLQPTPSSITSNQFVYPGATPSISADGTQNAILWATENGTTAVLYAYDAANLDHMLYNSNMAPNARDHFGTGNKYITPTIADGKVYIGTTDGVGVFGLLPRH
jgi:outer membrane protein assembly factor BamB